MLSLAVFGIHCLRQPGNRNLAMKMWGRGERCLGTEMQKRGGKASRAWGVRAGTGAKEEPLTACMWPMRSFLQSVPAMSELLSLKSLSPLPLSLPLNFASRPRDGVEATSLPEHAQGRWPLPGPGRRRRAAARMGARCEGLDRKQNKTKTKNISATG